jgi:hypothetical protein
MTWTKLSDDYTDETESLSDSGFRMLTELLVWSNRKLLNCVIPLRDLRRFAKNPDAIQEVLDGGWAELDGENVVIKYHAVYQRTREAVQNQQEVNRRNRAKAGKATPPGRLPQFSDESSKESSKESFDEMDWSGQDRENVKKKDLEEQLAKSKASEKDEYSFNPATGEITESSVLTSSEDLSNDEVF